MKDCAAVEIIVRYGQRGSDRGRKVYSGRVASFRGNLMAYRIIMIAALLISFAIGNAQAAEDIVAAHPKNVKVEFENTQVRVLRITLGAHEKMDLHEARDGVNIPLRDYLIVHTDSGGNAKQFPRVAGKPEWIPGGERVVESGDKPVEAILVELKAPAAAK
jgi:hypothetical protein